MTSLRDARLQRALHDAPDAGALPRQGTRAAIRAAAHAAVRPWWQRWRPAAGGARWAPAFATALLAGLVTVLWQGQDIPGPQPDADRPMPVPQLQPEPAAPVAPAIDKEPVIPGSTRDPLPRVAPAQPAKPAPRPSDAGVAQKAQERPKPLAAPAESPPPVVAKAAPAAAAMAPPPAPAAMADAASADMPRPAAGESRTRPAAAGLAAQSAPPVAAAAPALPLPRWTHVRIEGAGASVLVARDHPGLLSNLLDGLLRERRGPAAAAAGAASLRLELLDESTPAGVVERVGDEWRWTAAPGRPASVLRTQPHLSTALRAEAERLLRR